MQANRVLQDMIVIDEGMFLMGSIESLDEEPPHQVHMSSFAIDRIPVTNQLYRRFIDAGGYTNPAYWTAKGWEFIQRIGATVPNYWRDGYWNQDNHPVTGISWWEAMACACFLGKTLPTEAQWEYACKGLDNRRFPWGNEEPTQEYANFAPGCEPAELYRSSTSVDEHPKNVSYFGCLDMAGNLAEWCLDNWSFDYTGHMAHKDPCLITGEEDDHIARGGCGLHNEDFLRCSSRDWYPPTIRDNLIGFRCALNLY